MDTSSVRASLCPSRASSVAIAVGFLVGTCAMSCQAQSAVGASAQPQAPATVARHVVAAANLPAAQTDGSTSARGQAATVAQFDAQIMRERGLDPSIADYFRRAPRFTPGNSVVNVTLNGLSLGRKNAWFDGIGQLCFTAAFVKSIGLRPMTDAAGQPVPEGVPGSCLQYRDFATQTVVTLQPASGAVDIVTSPEFVESKQATVTEQGGVAGLLNYRAYALESKYDGARGTGYRQIDSTAGFNADDWIFRSQQTYTQTTGAQGNQSTFRLRSAYGQKTFAEQRQVFQGGRTSTQNPLYGGMAFTGAQWFPERALLDKKNFAVTGLANSRARVEVRQNGALLYSTVVPPGPFSVNDFALPNASSDLQVKVIEENGSEQAFSVPASALLLAAGSGIEEGLSVSGGQLWDTSGADTLKNSTFLTAAQGWRLGERVNGVVGGLVSDAYLSAGAGMNARLEGENNALYVQGIAARDSQHGMQGVQGSAALSIAQSPAVQYGFSGNVRSRDYRSLQEARSTNPQLGTPVSYRTQLSATARVNTESLGGLSAGITRQDYFVGTPTYTYSLGWNFSIHKAQVALGFAHNTARNLGTSANPAKSSNYLYANLTIPLDKDVTSNSFVRSSNETGRDVTRMGTTVDQRVNEYFGYRAAVEKTAGSNQSADTSVSAYAMPLYTSLTLGASQGSNHSSYYGEASGGVVVHGEGIAFTPSQVQDTFGVVKVGDVSGVRLDTPQGPVWSGINGLAAVPGLLPYHQSRIEVSGKSLPDDVDVTDALQVVQAGRGAVLKMNIRADRIRRVLLSVKLKGGAELPAGVAVLRNTNEFFTASASGGRVMLTNLQEGVVYSAQLPDGKSCTLFDIQVGDRVEGEQFERGTARCE